MRNLCQRFPIRLPDRTARNAPNLELVIAVPAEDWAARIGKPEASCGLPGYFNRDRQCGSCWQTALREDGNRWAVLTRCIAAHGCLCTRRGYHWVSAAPLKRLIPQHSIGQKFASLLVDAPQQVVPRGLLPPFRFLGGVMSLALGFNIREVHHIVVVFHGGCSFLG